MVKIFNDSRVLVLKIRIIHDSRVLVLKRRIIHDSRVLVLKLAINTYFSRCKLVVFYFQSCSTKQFLYYLPQYHVLKMNGDGNGKFIWLYLPYVAGPEVQITPCPDGHGVEIGNRFQLECSVIVQGYPPVYKYLW